MTQSNEATVEQMNIVIAGFEQRKFYGKWVIDNYGPETGNAYPEMKYHNDWNWLMPVLKNILKLIHSEEDLNMRRQMRFRWSPIANELSNLDIKNVHYCVYQFIQWYNNQNTNNGNE